MDEKTIEQTFATKKTDEGYYLEIFHDGKLVWTDTFKSEENLNRFIDVLNDAKRLGTVYLSQDEARIMLENNEYGVSVFYRHPLGYRTTSIFHNDVEPETNEHGFCVFFVNKDNFADDITVPTMDEAFQIIKDVEDGKI